MAEDVGLLTDDATKANAWMGDDTTWRDVYSAQPIDYLELVSNGETPAWDKNLEKFVAKGEESSQVEAEVSYSTPDTSTDTTTTVEDNKEDDELPF